MAYDGFDDSAPELLRQCGTQLPNSISSSGNGLFIKLIGGRFDAHVRFKLTFS